MNAAGWIYDHAPSRVQRWMDDRVLDRQADEEYKRYMARKENGEMANPFGGEHTRESHFDPKKREEQFQTSQHIERMIEQGRQIRGEDTDRRREPERER